MAATRFPAIATVSGRQSCSRRSGTPCSSATCTVGSANRAKSGCTGSPRRSQTIGDSAGTAAADPAGSYQRAHHCHSLRSHVPSAAMGWRRRVGMA